MKVHELISQLQRRDPNAEIELVIHQYNKRYPVAYIPIDDVDYPVTESPAYRGSDTPRNIRISVSLPKNMRTATMKKEAA
jgi:hypothetical protein